MSSVLVGAQVGGRGIFSLKLFDPQCNSCEFRMVLGEVYRLSLHSDE